MLCLVIAVVGVTTVARMPVDLFPQIKIPVVVVATFYSGMPPEQVEADITDTFERFFTLGSNIDHIESRSLTGVSLIKIYFKPGSDANEASAISQTWQWRTSGVCRQAHCRRWYSSSMLRAFRFVW
jgi:multidrug efflux pump subunit AcrB